MPSILLQLGCRRIRPSAVNKLQYLNLPEQTRKMRLPYVANPPPPSTNPEEDAIVSRIQARRAPRPLQPLDLALLHSPPVADGWNSFLGAVRTRTLISADLREIAISRVAVVNRAWYEWAHHAPLAVAGGVSREGMEAIKTEEPLVLGQTEKPAELTEQQWVVACYTDEMTRNVQVRDETFAELKRVMGGGDREVVEVTATVACYNCVSRFLVALDVGERNGTGPDATH
ncbi:AhpD-like protein [Cladorrhinum sp. PSN259]|nr:AhpD-like protein [Cladorrhinum sp. PSN259]